MDIHVTPKAVAKAKQKLQEADKPVEGLRLGVKGGACSGVAYAIDFADRVRPTDRVFEFDGLKVVVDPKSLKYLKGVTLDWEERLMGYGFKFINPNAKGGCGCGMSFEI